MNIGDKVKHKAHTFVVEGTVVGLVTPSCGDLLVAVEEIKTHFVHLFGLHSLDIVHDFAPLEIPKRTLPFDIWVPVKAIPAGGGNRRVVARTIQEKWLMQMPIEALITQKVNAEIEFHFIGVKSGDLDNLLKPTLDLLKGSVIRDDNQVIGINARILENMKEPGFRIKLYDPEG